MRNKVWRLMASRHIVKALLDKGLAESTWRDSHPDAYDDLLKYREDMELHIRRLLVRMKDADA